MFRPRQEYARAAHINVVNHGSLSAAITRSVQDDHVLDRVHRLSGSPMFRLSALLLGLLLAISGFSPAVAAQSGQDAVIPGTDGGELAHFR